MSARPGIAPRTMSANQERLDRILANLGREKEAPITAAVALRAYAELDAERANSAALLAVLDGVANSLEAEVRRADGSGAHLQSLVDYCRAAIAQAKGGRS